MTKETLNTPMGANIEWQTVIYIAIAKGHSGIVQTLLENRADPSASCCRLGCHVFLPKKEPEADEDMVLGRGDGSYTGLTENHRQHLAWAKLQKVVFWKQGQAANTCKPENNYKILL